MPSSDSCAALQWSDESRFPLDWNGPTERAFRPFPEDAKARPIAELIEAVVARDPERIALINGTSSLTYGQLQRASAAWAERIAAATSPGELVAILAPTAFEFPVAMLACLAAGRPFVAIDPRNPAEWVHQALQAASPALLLTSNAGFVETAAVPKVFELREQAVGPASGWQHALMTPDEPACVLFTSGSTGTPKGIVNSQRNLLQRVYQSINAAHIDSDDRFLTLASLCTIVGVRDLLTALLAGASFVLFDTHQAAANEILRAVREHRVSILFAFPALLRSVVANAEERSGDHLRLVRIGGDTTLWSDIVLLRAWLAPTAFIQLIYAATEAPMMQSFVARAQSDAEDKIPIGYALRGNALAIVDENGEPVQDGEAGELLVRSRYVALGYWSNGRCEPADIRADPHESDVRILRTGDLVRRRSDGCFDRIGRKDRQVKIRGARVELDGVEIALRRHPQVRDAAVIARSEEDGSVRLIAYIERHENAQRTLLDDLRAMMSRTMPAHAVPSRFCFTPRIPRLSTSKLDVPALQRLDGINVAAEAQRQSPREDFDSLRGDTLQGKVALAWRKVLGIADVAENADFFALGGDSLRAIALAVELEKSLGKSIPLTLINEAPAFGAFCAALAKHRFAEYSPLVVIKTGRGHPPLFLIHGAGGSVMELFTLARGMTWSGPVIGIQARGLDGSSAPHRSVDVMAEEYLAAMKARQPNGPYLLCGYSFGGLLAFAIAQRLRAAQEEVAFLGLLDTLPPQHHFLRLWTWLAYLQRDLRQRVFASRGPRLLGWLGNAAVARARSVAISALQASLVYRPEPYAGEIDFFEPSVRDLRAPSAATGWSRFATTVRRHTLQGRHMDMLAGERARIAARVISECAETAMKRAHRDAA